MRYRVNDLPVKGVGAFTPLLATTPAASSQGELIVEGAPGTDLVDAPDPAALPSLTARGGVNSAQGSKVTPDAIFPAIYVARTANLGPAADAGIGMWRRRHNELPMPALTPFATPAVAQTAPRVGGRLSMPWPRAFQRFPARSGSRG